MSGTWLFSTFVKKVDFKLGKSDLDSMSLRRSDPYQGLCHLSLTVSWDLCNLCGTPDSALFLCKTGSKEFSNGALKNHYSVMPRIMMIQSSDVENWISHLYLRKIYSNHFYPSTHNSLIMKLNYSSVTYLHAHFASTITKLCNPK